jgi:SAM-dependent methyltransferase
LVGWNVEGVEWDPTAAEAARNISKERVVVGDFKAIELPLGAFDLVIVNHVLEHLDSPTVALCRIRDLLVPGGRAVLVYPNPQSLGARIFGGAWYPWEVPRHLVLPQVRALARAANAIGLTSIKVETRCDKHAKGYFAQSRAYKSDKFVNGSPPSVTGTDHMIAMCERILITIGIDVGEEAMLVLEKRIS